MARDPSHAERMAMARHSLVRGRSPYAGRRAKAVVSFGRRTADEPLVTSDGVLLTGEIATLWLLTSVFFACGIR